MAKQVAVIEIKNPEAALEAILRTVAASAFNDGVGQWISNEEDVNVESLDDDEKIVWDIYLKIKEQL